MKCSECGAMNNDGDRYCTSCGKPLSETAQSGGAQTVTCPACGYANIAGSEICANCMADLHLSKETPHGHEHPPRKEKKKTARKSAASDEKKKREKPAEDAPKKKLSKKQILCILAVILIIALLGGIVGLILNARANADHKTLQSIPQTLYQAAEDKTYVTLRGKLLKQAIDGAITDEHISLNGNAAVYVTGAQEPQSLWFADRGGVRQLSSDVGDYVFSSQGTVVLYISSVGKNTHAGILHCYDVKSKSDTVIDKSAYTVYAISPDGGSFIYAARKNVTIEDSSEAQTLIQLVADGETRALENSLRPVALTDHAEYLYYLKEDTLFARRGNADMNIGACVGTFYFNRSLSEVVFCSGQSYGISALGAEMQSFSENLTSFVLPPRTISFTVPCRTDADRVTILPIDSFSGALFFVDNALWQVDKNLHTDLLFEMCGSAQTLPKSKDVYYTALGGGVGRFRPAKADKRTLLTDEAVDYFVTPDGKHFYYTTERGGAKTLFYLNKDNTVTAIAANVSSAAMSKDGVLYYTTRTGSKSELLSVEKGTETKSIRTDSEHEQSVYADAAGKIFLRVDVLENRQACYVMKSKTKVSLLLENVGNVPVSVTEPVTQDVTQADAA